MLWAAIRTTQKRWPEAVCVVYTGDHEVSKDEMIKKVQVCSSTILFEARILKCLPDTLQHFAVPTHTPLPLPHNAPLRPC